MNSDKKKIIGDLLFWSQIIFGTAFGLGQSLRMLVSVQGVSISMIVFTWLAMLVNLHLVLSAHRVQRSRATLQTVVVFLQAVAVYTTLTVIILSHGKWDLNDTVTATSVGIGLVAILAVCLRRKLTYADPIVRCWFAICMRCAPILLMAYKIHCVGGSGFSGTMMLVVHPLTLSRVGQIWLTVREAGWDRNRRGAFIAVLGDEMAWMAVTVAWLWWCINS